MKRTVKCSDCGSPIIDENNVCPKCGSESKSVFLGFSENLGGSIHEQIRGKVKKQGTKKPTKEFIYGDDKRRVDDSWVKKTRIIDRENNQYTEVVKNKETDETMHECSEPLSEHFGHGSAKFKKEKNEK